MIHLQVKYAALPNFEEREEDFRAESVLLRRRFTDEGAALFCLELHIPDCEPPWLSSQKDHCQCSARIH